MRRAAILLFLALAAGADETPPLGFQNIRPRCVVRNGETVRFDILGKGIGRRKNLTVLVGYRKATFTVQGDHHLSVYLSTNGMPVGALSVRLEADGEVYSRDRAFYLAGEMELISSSLARGDPLRIRLPGVPHGEVKVIVNGKALRTKTDGDALGVIIPAIDWDTAADRGEMAVEVFAFDTPLTTGKIRLARPKGTSKPKGTKPWDILKRIAADKSRGTLRLGDRDYTLVFIPRKDDYVIGLTREQKVDPDLAGKGFAEPSYVAGGPLKVALRHPFLIQETEVTTWQYWAYVQAARLSRQEIPKFLQDRRTVPNELRNLPVTGVTYVQAVAFAEWLSRELESVAPGWEARLPHEIEWEMAARGDSRRFVFPDADRRQALKAFRHSDLRAVGSNPRDLSWKGVRDLGGNAREWTASVYNKNLLSILHLKRGDYDGWDPRDPYDLPNLLERAPRDPKRRSVRMTVRGGGAGDPPALLQVSVRRTQEFATADETIGFRLVFVEKAR